MALLPPETGGWFNKEINSPDDFKDITMRIFGLGRNIIEGLGAKAVFIPQNKLISAFESSEINAAEFSAIEIDASISLPNVAKYWYAPSWNQLSTVLYFACYLKKLQSLSKKQQEMTKQFLKENIYSNYLKSNSKQIDFLNKYKSQLKTFPDNVLDALRQSWLDWLNKPENLQVKNEYKKIKDFSTTFYAYEDIMKKNVD